ncbi:MAG: hypothetical protein NT085_03585 [candidate division SR1 bacterium]|nr:hypothetical protein [candidate division SR1 bacterium]
MEEIVQANVAEQQSNIVGKTPEVVTPMIIESSKEVYIPSSTEKKRAVMMYLLIGIIVVAFNNQKKSDFEQFHLKQALGWRAVFLLLVVVTSIFMFIPMIKYIPIIIVVVMVTFLAIFIKKARDGKYSISQENKLAIFVGLGEWIMNLFEVNKENNIPEIKTEQPNPEAKS